MFQTNVKDDAHMRPEQSSPSGRPLASTRACVFVHLGPRRLRFGASRSRLELTSDDPGRPGDRAVTGELETRPGRARTRPGRP